MSHDPGMVRRCAEYAGRNLAGRAAPLAHAAALAACLLATMARADGPYEATSSRAAREDAIRSIPLDKFDAESRAKVASVLSNISMYRRMPTQVTRCEADLYLFMINHPDVIVNLWQVLDVTNIQLQQMGPNHYRANDGQGTKGDVEFLYRSRDLHIVHTVGTYEGALFARPVRGSCLLVLKTGYSRDADGQCFITSQLDTFFNVEHIGWDLITKTFHPLVGKAADYNFIESANFLATLQRTGELRPTAMQQLAGKLTNVQPEHRQQFALLMAAAGQRAAPQQPGSNTSGPSLDDTHPTTFRR